MPEQPWFIEQDGRTFVHLPDVIRMVEDGTWFGKEQPPANETAETPACEHCEWKAVAHRMLAASNYSPLSDEDGSLRAKVLADLLNHEEPWAIHFGHDGDKVTLDHTDAFVLLQRISTPDRKATT